MYKSKREEIENLAEENLRRKRQKRAYDKIRADIRKDVEAEYKSRQNTPHSSSSTSMPKPLILLIIINGILLAATFAMSLSISEQPDLIKYGIIIALVSIPTLLILLYIGYLLLYVWIRVYWWWNLIWTLFWTLAIVYAFVSALFGHMILIDPVERLQTAFQAPRQIQVDSAMINRSTNLQELQTRLQQLQSVSSDLQQLQAQLDPSSFSQIDQLNQQVESLQLQLDALQSTFPGTP